MSQTNITSSPIRAPHISPSLGVKKGGAGGRGVWGKPGDELVDHPVSPNDPNYDPDEEASFMLDPVTPSLTGRLFKEHVDTLIQEYFDGIVSIQEFGNRIVMMNSPLYAFYVVRKTVRIGLPQREIAVCSLFRYLTSPAVDVISREQMMRGLSDAILNMEEWELDAPNFKSSLRSVIDNLVESDCLRSSFLEKELTMLEKRAALKIRILDALEEFFVSFVYDDFVRLLEDLDCPAFHGQVVKFIFRSAVEKPPEKIEQAAILLERVSGPKKPISMLQFMQGVELLLGECEDMMLDNPGCKDILAQLIVRVVVDECVPPSLLENVFAVAPGDAGNDVLKSAAALLQSKGAAEKIHEVWNPSS